MAINGLAVGYTTVGLILVVSGFTNNPLWATIESLLKGKVPPSHSTGPISVGVTDPNSSNNNNNNNNSIGQADTGSVIANDALKYVGHKYVWGGPSNPQGGWDCSSFVSYVLGHDLNMQIPGGSWSKMTNNGSSHGPVVAQYYMWTGASQVSKSQVQAGDLIIFPPDTHIGIATSNTKFVSAEDPKDGTNEADISAGPGPWVARRIKGVSSPGPQTGAQPGKSATAGGPGG